LNCPPVTNASGVGRMGLLEDVICSSLLETAFNPGRRFLPQFRQRLAPRKSAWTHCGQRYRSSSTAMKASVPISRHCGIARMITFFPTGMGKFSMRGEFWGHNT